MDASAGRAVGTRSRSRACREALALVVAAVVGACVALTGCSSTTTDAPPQAGAGEASDPPQRDPAMPASFAAVGDSITDADSTDFAAGDLGAESWAAHVVAAGSPFAGGWAEWGALTGRMAESVRSIDADVLVIVAGTNDVAFALPFEDSARNLDRIVDTVGIDEVVVSSIPPIDADPEGADRYNAELEQLADARGWRFVDASAGLRTDDGRFRDDLSYDGLHPSAEGARVLGDAIADELRDLNRSAPPARR